MPQRYLRVLESSRLGHKKSALSPSEKVGRVGSVAENSDGDRVSPLPTFLGGVGSEKGEGADLKGENAGENYVSLLPTFLEGKNPPDQKVGSEKVGSRVIPEKLF
jgi:hypothetical protein